MRSHQGGILIIVKYFAKWPSESPLEVQGSFTVNTTISVNIYRAVK